MTAGISFGHDSTNLKEPPAWNVAPGMRHHHLMHSNEPPLETDVESIQKAVSDVDTRLASLDEEITRLEAQVKQLQEERTAQMLYRQQNLAILSPLRRIPPELLSEVFYWTLPDIHDERARGRIELAESPWVLSHVSSRWRAISISTPSLWSRLVIAFGENHEPRSSYPLCLVQAHIQRSQNMNLIFEGCETCDRDPQVETFLVLAQHSSRWVELSIELTLPLFPLLSNLRGRLSSLRKVWLSWNCEESQAGIDSIDCLEIAPVLVDVGISYDSRYIPTILPIYRLTRYSIDAPWEVHREILKLATNLLEARICLAFDESQPWPEPSLTSVSSPSLRRLYSSHLLTLNYIAAPNLKEMSVEFDSDEIPCLLQVVNDFLCRSLCPLRSFCLATFPSSSAAMALSILQTVPSIIELGIFAADDEAMEEVNAFMSAMNSTDDAVPSALIAPHLRRISIACENEGTIDYALYLEMIKSRWRAGTLTTAELLVENSTRMPDHTTTRALQALRENGLDFFMRDGAPALDIMDDWLFAS